VNPGTTDTAHTTTSPWHLITYRQHEVRSGIYWEAMLMHGDQRVGTVYQEGNGGADVVEITHPAARALWNKYVTTEHDGNQEHATYRLMVEEDSRI